MIREQPPVIFVSVITCTNPSITGIYRLHGDALSEQVDLDRGHRFVCTKVYTQHEAVARVMNYLRDKSWMPPSRPASVPNGIYITHINTSPQRHMIRPNGTTPVFSQDLGGGRGVALDSVRVKEGAEQRLTQKLAVWQHQHRPLAVALLVDEDRQPTFRPTCSMHEKRWDQHHNQVHR